MAPSRQADDIVELRDHVVVLAADVIARGENVSGIDAHADAAPASRRERAMISASSSNVAPSAVPLPAVVSRSTRTRPGTRESLPRSRRRFREPARAVVHEVARVRHERAEPEGLAASQLADEGLDRASAERRVRRRKVDEIAVVRVERAEIGLGQCGTKRLELRGLAFPLGPPARHLREDLHGGRADGFGARRGLVGSAGDGSVGA